MTIHRAVGILQRSPSVRLMTLDETKNFLRDGEQLLFEPVELSLLRAELRKAKQWKSRIDRLGENLLQADDDEISEIVAEANTICIDLSSSLQVRIFAYVIELSIC